MSDNWYDPQPGGVRQYGSGGTVVDLGNGRRVTRGTGLAAAHEVYYCVEMLTFSELEALISDLKAIRRASAQQQVD